MSQEFNVRFKNTGSDDVNYVAVHALAQVQGHLNPGEYDDFTGPFALYEGSRVVTIFSTFPPAVKFSKTININHDYFIVKITDNGIVTAFGDGGFSE